MEVTKKQMRTLLEATEIKPNKGRVNIIIEARAEAVALDGAREGAEALLELRRQSVQG